jgi:hypothetical protein
VGRVVIPRPTVRFEPGFRSTSVQTPVPDRHSALRLRWEVSEDAADRLAEDNAWAKLDEADRKELTQRLSGLMGTSTTDRNVVADKLGTVPKAMGLPPLSLTRWSAPRTVESG